MTLLEKLSETDEERRGFLRLAARGSISDGELDEELAALQIARSLGIHRHTVEKYLAFKTPPERHHFPKKVSAIAPYEDYILRRWKQGCRNAAQIHREIVEQGYPGAYQNVEYGSPATSKSKKCWENPYRTLHRASLPAMPRRSL